MTEKKQGLWQRFKGLLSKPNPAEDIEIKLSQWGMSLEEQKDLQTRLYTQKMVFKYLAMSLDGLEPKELLNRLERKLYILDAAIGLTSAPWAAPGDNDRRAKWFESWQTYHADGITLINAIRRYYVNDEETPNTVEYANISTQEILGMLSDVLVKHYFSVGKIVVSKCFFDKHTTPRQIAMVQNMAMPMMQSGYGETITSSGGRTSETPNLIRKPDDRPVPSRVKNTV